MADIVNNPLENNEISCESNLSGTCSFSYPGLITGKTPVPSTITRNAPSFRKPVRILPFMREALKKTEIKRDEKNSIVQLEKEVGCLSRDTDCLPDSDVGIHVEQSLEMGSFTHNAEHSVGSLKSVNEDSNTFQGMGWLMESGQKDLIAQKIREQQPDGRTDKQVFRHVTQPSSVNNLYTNFSTPLNRHTSHMGVFKEVSNSTSLKSGAGIQQNNKTPLKKDPEHNENIYMCSSTNKSQSVCSSIKSQYSSARKITVVDTNHIVTPSNHKRECASNVRRQLETPYRSKQVLQELPITVQTTPAYGCPVKFSVNMAPPRHVDNNQNKENDIQQNLGLYKDIIQTEEPLNLNLKDLTGQSEHDIDLKMNTKPNIVQSRNTPHQDYPIGKPRKLIQYPGEVVPKSSQRDIQSHLQMPLTTLDSLDEKSFESIQPQGNMAKAAKCSDNVMFSLPVAKALNSSLTVNGKPYVVISQLGTGGSSKVYQVMENGSSATYAVKCVDLASVDKAIAQGYLNEIELLKKLQHCDSVIKLFGYEYVAKTKTLLVVMEKGDTDFSNFLRDINKTKKVSDLLIAYYWTEMVTAVDNIHKYGIIHSDLKPPNFLLVAGRLKLIDFGIASSINVDMTSVVKDQMMGTFNYMSPEAIGALNNAVGENALKRKITFKSDIWSLGCILYNLVYGRTPFAHINGIGKLVEIYNPQHEIKYPDVDYPAVLVGVTKRCLTYDPLKRPSTTELLQSPLLPRLENPF